jgi:hypothetical protein
MFGPKTQKMVRCAWALYNCNWDVFENDTEVDFITSDNPSSFEDQGDGWPSGYPPFVRILPLTPRLCVACDLTHVPKAIREMPPDFTQFPLGTIRGGLVDLNTVTRINICIVKCAEDLVLCGFENDYVRDLTRTYSAFRVETESARFKTSKGFLVSNRTRVIDRTGNR